MNEVYINRISGFLPNEVIESDEMEDYLGYIDGRKSKSKRIILNRNGIKKRYYAIDKEQNTTHTNAEMVSEAVKGLFENKSEMAEVDLLACGTSTPDQFFPSHAVMVHGLLPETNNIEVISNSGVCCSGMHALKYAYMSIKTGDKSKAVTTGSERVSKLLMAKNFEDEVQQLKKLQEDPYLSFEKDFLRWMLSDGAGAMLLEPTKNEKGISLRVDWIEAASFANEAETCMYHGASKDEEGNFISYMEHTTDEWTEKSVFGIKQDVKLLGENIVKYGQQTLNKALEKHGASVDDIAYFLPHLSSHFFEKEIDKSLIDAHMAIPKEKWFTNLSYVGNVGAGSIYLILGELFNNNKLKAGDQLLLMVPESARFSYVYAWLTVC